MMIVLHTLKYGDTSLIIHGYTKEEGRVSFILRGAFRQSSGKRSAPRPEVVSLHPLSIVNYVASKNMKGSMPYLREFSPKYRLHSIREDFDKISIAMFISELLYRTLLHSERDEELYDFLEDAVLRFCGFWHAMPHSSDSLSRGGSIWITTRLLLSRQPVCGLCTRHRSRRQWSWR